MEKFHLKLKERKKSFKDTIKKKLKDWIQDENSDINCQIHFESTKLTNRQLSIILNEICAELKRRMLN